MFLNLPVQLQIMCCSETQDRHTQWNHPQHMKQKRLKRAHLIFNSIIVVALWFICLLDEKPRITYMMIVVATVIRFDLNETTSSKHVTKTVEKSIKHL